MRKLITLLILSTIVFSCKEDNKVEPKDNTNSILNDTTITNISYGTHVRQVYDIHLPAGRDTTTPVIIMIHGGAWKAGQKEDMNNYVNLIKASWKDVAIVNMNYRLASNSDNIHHDQIMSDINDVIQAIKDSQTQYQISSTHTGIMGASAGGQLAMIYAYRYNHHNNINCVATIFGPSILSDWSWYNSTNPWLGGYVGDIITEYAGQTWDTTAYKAISPYWNITANTQPTILFHGNLDVIVPVYQSQWMHGKLNKTGITNEYHEYLASHGFDNTQNQDVVSKLTAFFQKHIN